MRRPLFSTVPLLLSVAATTAGCAADVDDAGLGVQTSAITLSPTVKLSAQRRDPESPLPDAHSHSPRTSVDGRYVAFIGRNSRMTDTITNAHPQAYLANLETDELTALTRYEYVRSIDVSGDGRFVVIRNQGASVISERGDGVHVYDRTTDAWTEVMTGATQHKVAISADGSTVAFVSTRSDLVAGDTNEIADLFLWDRASGDLSRVPHPLEDGELRIARISGPRLSGDGRFVGFAASHLANDWNGSFVYDRELDESQRVDLLPNGNAPSQSSFHDLSADGRYALYTAQVSGESWRLMVFDRVTGTNQIVDRSTSGEIANRSAISGHFSLSPDGRFVGWTTRALNLHSNDVNEESDVFVRDRLYGVTERMTLAPSGLNSWGSAMLGVSLANAGSVVAFTSEANDLVANEPDDGSDVYARPLWSAPVTGDVVHINQYERYSWDPDRYQHAGAATAGNIDIVASVGGDFVESVNGVVDLPGVEGGTALLEIRIERIGGELQGHVALEDLSVGETFRADHLTGNLSVERIGEGEVVIAIDMPGQAEPPEGAPWLANPRGIRLSVRKSLVDATSYIPVAGHGFAWNGSAVASSTASSSYSYNGDDQQVRFVRRGTGRYRIEVPGAADLEGAATSIAAYGSDATFCNYAGSRASGDDLHIDVGCFAPSGARADSRFAAAWVRDDMVAGPGLAHVTFDGSDVLASGNSTGEAVSVRKQSTGVYSVFFPGQQANGSNVQVTARSATSTRCKVGGWSSSAATVRCHTASGTPVDSGFDVVFTAGRTAHGGAGGAVWASNTTSSDYATSSYYGFNSEGEQNRAGAESEVGKYWVTFGGLPGWNTSPQVTAYGSDASYCKVRSWGGNARVRVACFDSAGVGVATRFTASYRAAQ